MSKRSAKPTHPPAAQPHPRLLTSGFTAIKQCKHGLMMYNLNDLFVGRGLELYGEWCDAELAALGQMLRPGDVVLDVGANIGTHTLFFAQKVAPGGVVYGFEPQRITYEYLCANLALNGLHNAIPLQAAVGEAPGEITIPLLDQSKQQNFAALNVEGHAAGEAVRLMPIDALALKRCNLIKIDVEGMERKVLKGAEKTIAACRPFLFVENNTREGAPETVQMLLDWDYTCWWHIAPYYNPQNFFHNPENVWANLVPESNMICAPRELNLAVSGFEPLSGPDDTWVQALTRLGVIK